MDQDCSATMASVPIEIDTTLDASGGSNDSVSETVELASRDGAFQWELSGSSTDVDIFVEARLSDNHSWSDYLKFAGSDREGASAANGDGQGPLLLDTGGITQLRVRVVNNDGSNTADVTATLSSS